MKKAFFLGLCLSFCSTNFAATSMSQKEDSLEQMRSELKKQQTTLSTLRSQLSKFEMNLGENNKKIIEILGQRKQLEITIFETGQRLEKSKTDLEENLDKTKSSLRALVLGSLDDVETSTDLLSKKILTNILQKKIEVIKNELKLNNQLSLDLAELKKDYDNHIRTENDLRIVLDDLEKKKKDIASKYIEEEKAKDATQIKYDQLRTTVYLSKQKKQHSKEEMAPVSDNDNEKMEFAGPVEGHSGVEHNKKGITFKFKGQLPVKSAGKGKVAYTGSLSNYGNVVIVDHGNQTRTIYLGQFLPKVKAESLVEKGQVLGYTQAGYSTGSRGSVYFEVRKRNIAQNTVLLMDQDFLAKNSLAKN